MENNLKKAIYLAFISSLSVFLASCDNEATLNSLETTKQMVSEGALSESSAFAENGTTISIEPQLRFQFEDTAADDNGLVQGKLIGDIGFSNFSSPAPSGGKSLISSGGYVALDDASLKDGFEKYTVLFWVENFSDLAQTVIYEEGGEANGFGIRIDEDNKITAKAKAGNASVEVTDANPILTEGFTYLVAAVYDRGDLSLYISRDGSTGQFFTANTVSGGPAQIPEHPDAAGIMNTNNGNVFAKRDDFGASMKLDDLRIYDGVALTESQIREVIVALPEPQLRFQFEDTATDDKGLVQGELIGDVRFTSVLSPAPSGGKSITQSLNGSVAFDTPLLQDGFNKYTVLFWMESLSSLPEAVLYEEGGNANGFGIRLDSNNKITAKVKAGSRSVELSSSQNILAEGFNYFVAAVYDLTTLTLYISRDGSLDQFYTVDAITGAPAQIPDHRNGAGILRSNDGDVFGNIGGDGSSVIMDDLRIYDGEALTEDQIRAIIGQGN